MSKPVDKFSDTRTNHWLENTKVVGNLDNSFSRVDGRKTEK